MSLYLEDNPPTVQYGDGWTFSVRCACGWFVKTEEMATGISVNRGSYCPSLTLIAWGHCKRCGRVQLDLIEGGNEP